MKAATLTAADRKARAAMLEAFDLQRTSDARQIVAAGAVAYAGLQGISAGSDAELRRIARGHLASWQHTRSTRRAPR